LIYSNQSSELTFEKNYQWMAPIFSTALQWKRSKPGKHSQKLALQCFLYLFCFRSNPLHRIEFGPPKFFSKTFRFSIIFYSTLQIFGGGHFRKACRSRKKEPKQSEITCNHSELARTISKIEKRREFVRALCYQQCPKNSFKRLYIVKELLFWSKKLHFQKNFGRNFNAVERVI